jgi:hypothetical protein
MTLEMFLAQPSVQALGRALFHFIWQGSLLALLLWFVKTITPPSAARLRYAAASLIMLAMPIALIVTVTWDSRSAQQSDAPAARFSPHAPATTPAQRVYDAPVSSRPHAGIRVGRVHLDGWSTLTLRRRRRQLDEHPETDA